MSLVARRAADLMRAGRERMAKLTVVSRHPQRERSLMSDRARESAVALGGLGSEACSRERA